MELFLFPPSSKLSSFLRERREADCCCFDFGINFGERKKKKERLDRVFLEKSNFSIVLFREVVLHGPRKSVFEFSVKDFL